MTDKTKMSNLESYQELTIQISTLNLKLDKILSLLNKPEINIASSIDGSWTEAQIKEYQQNVKQFVETFSIDEQFSENFK